MPDIPTDATADLYALLSTAFNEEGFRVFWLRVFGPYALDGLSGETYQAIVASAVDSLVREAKADEPFFRAIERERPNHRTKIWLVAARWGVVRSPDPPIERIVHASWWTGPRVAAASMLLVTASVVGLLIGRQTAPCPKISMERSQQVAAPTSNDSTAKTDDSAKTEEFIVRDDTAETSKTMNDPSGQTLTAAANASDSRFPSPPLPELLDLEQADGDKSDAGLRARVAARQAMLPGFKERLVDIRECFREWTTVGASSCPYEPFYYFNVWYDVRLGESGEIVEVKFRTRSMVRETPDVCVRDRWLTRTVRASPVTAGTWTLKLKIPAPVVPGPTMKDCHPR